MKEKPGFLNLFCIFALLLSGFYITTPAQAQLTDTIEKTYNEEQYTCGFFEDGSIKAGQINRKGKFVLFETKFKRFKKKYRKTGNVKFRRKAKKFRVKNREGKKACVFNFKLNKISGIGLLILPTLPDEDSGLLRVMSADGELSAVFADAKDPEVYGVEYLKDWNALLVTFASPIDINTGIATEAGCSIAKFDLKLGIPTCVSDMAYRLTDHHFYSENFDQLSPYPGKYGDCYYLSSSYKPENKTLNYLLKLCKDDSLTPLASGDEIYDFYVNPNDGTVYYLYFGENEQFDEVNQLLKINPDGTVESVFKDVITRTDLFFIRPNGNILVYVGIPDEQEGLWEIDMATNTVLPKPLIGDSSVGPVPSILDCDDFPFGMLCPFDLSMQMFIDKDGKEWLYNDALVFYQLNPDFTTRFILENDNLGNRIYYDGKILANVTDDVGDKGFKIYDFESKSLITEVEDLQIINIRKYYLSDNPNIVYIYGNRQGTSRYYLGVLDLSDNSYKELLRIDNQKINRFIPATFQ